MSKNNKYYEISNVAKFMNPVELDECEYVGARLAQGPDVRELQLAMNLAMIGTYMAEKVSSFVLSEDGDNIKDNPVAMGIAWVVRHRDSFRNDKEVEDYITQLRDALAVVNTECPAISSRLYNDMTNVW